MLQKKETLLFFSFLLLLVFSLTNKGDIWWDAAVYIGMGKYIYSLGTVGLWEPNRPLIWPFIVGVGWLLKINIILWAKILTLFFTAGCVFLTYTIAKIIMKKEAATFAAVMLACWPIFFLYATVLQTEIPATFFFLWGVYAISKTRYACAGFILSISFLTRFFQILLIIPIIALLIYTLWKKKEQKNILSMLCFFSLPILLFLITNQILYENPLYPFAVQKYMTENTGWVFHQPWWYYFKEIVTENILSIFIVPGLCLMLFHANTNAIEQKKQETKMIAVTTILASVPFFLTAHKEMRILIPLLPFFSISVVYFFIHLQERLQKKVARILIFVVAIFWILCTLPQLHWNTYEDNLDFFYENARATPEDATSEEGGLWISNPAFIAATEHKAEVLVYYPLYNTEKIQALQKNISTANMIWINTCDILPCPGSDKNCSEEHEKLLNILQKEFVLVDRKQTQDSACDYFIFKKSVS